MVSRVALVHATPLAMGPIAASFAKVWPAADCMNLLDDCLSKDLAKDGQMTPAMMARVLSLASYAQRCGADAIQFTCSSFGPAIDAAANALGMPVLKPNEAMFEAAIAACAGRDEACVGLLTTFVPATASMAQEWQDATQHLAVRPTLLTACAQDALAALNAGDADLHDQLVLKEVAKLAHCDVIMLGQFSMARAQAQVAHATGQMVLASPDSAVSKLKHLLDRAPH